MAWLVSLEVNGSRWCILESLIDMFWMSPAREETNKGNQPALLQKLLLASNGLDHRAEDTGLDMVLLHFS